jgi:hypothetical protein
MREKDLKDGSPLVDLGDNLACFLSRFKLSFLIGVKALYRLLLSQLTRYGGSLVINIVLLELKAFPAAHTSELSLPVSTV